MLIVGSSQTEQRRECLLFESERQREGARERSSVTVLCCGKQQQPGGAELKTQTVFRGILFLMATFVPEEGKKDQWPVLLPSLHTTMFQLNPTGSQNPNI